MGRVRVVMGGAGRAERAAGPPPPCMRLHMRSPTEPSQARFAMCAWLRYMLTKDFTAVSMALLVWPLHAARHAQASGCLVTCIALITVQIVAYAGSPYCSLRGAAFGSALGLHLHVAPHA